MKKGTDLDLNQIFTEFLAKMYSQLINSMSTAKTRSSCKQNAQWCVNFQH